MLAILMLSACKTTAKIVEVPVEVVKKEYIHDTKIDSVYIRDSVDRWQKGDTLYITKWHTKFKYINKVDTIVKTDSIPKTEDYPVYYEFKTVEELDEFYKGMINHITSTVKEGWNKRNSINWDNYKLPEFENKERKADL